MADGRTDFFGSSFDLPCVVLYLCFRPVRFLPVLLVDHRHLGRTRAIRVDPQYSQCFKLFPQFAGSLRVGLIGPVLIFINLNNYHHAHILKENIGYSIAIVNLAVYSYLNLRIKLHKKPVD